MLLLQVIYATANIKISFCKYAEKKFVVCFIIGRRDNTASLSGAYTKIDKEIVYYFYSFAYTSFEIFQLCRK